MQLRQIDGGKRTAVAQQAQVGNRPKQIYPLKGIGLGTLMVTEVVEIANPDAVIVGSCGGFGDAHYQLARDDPARHDEMIGQHHIGPALIVSAQPEGAGGRVGEVGKIAVAQQPRIDPRRLLAGRGKAVLDPALERDAGQSFGAGKTVNRLGKWKLSRSGKRRCRIGRTQ